MINFGDGSEVAGATSDPPHLLRCACDGCGAHVMARRAYRIAGQCGNCGSYRIVPLSGAG